MSNGTTALRAKVVGAADSNESLTAQNLDYASLYKDLKLEAGLPEGWAPVIDSHEAVFEGLYLDLGKIKQAIDSSGIKPLKITVYADVLKIPSELRWSISASSILLFARRIEADSSAQIFLDFRSSQLTRLILFSDDLSGSLSVVAVLPGGSNPHSFHISSTPAPRLTIAWSQGAPASLPISAAQAFPVLATDSAHELALNNSFMLASLFYDGLPSLAIDILRWTKAWASASPNLNGLYLRSASLLALLESQAKAASDGCIFVPYLTGDVYKSLAQAYVSEATAYESNYMQLNTQKVLTDENISLAKTLLNNAIYESSYVNALLQQALRNYRSAIAAVDGALASFREQQTAIGLVRIDFEKVGLPEYERKTIVTAVFTLAQALVQFACGIGAMLVGQEEAAPEAAAAAESAEKAVESSAEAAQKGSELAKHMKSLKELIEKLKKVYEFSQSLLTAASNIEQAGNLVSSMQALDLDSQSATINSTSEWEIFQLQADAVLKDPIDAGIKYASDYKQALDILVIKGQALANARIAAIRAGQDYAKVLLQQQLAQRQQKQLAAYVNALKSGEAPIASMMQQFYLRYLDAKSFLLAALENYSASYYYWALQPSSVRPRIIDRVNQLDSGLRDLTSIAMDTAAALQQLNPPPSTMADKEFVVDSPDILSALREKKSATWLIDLDAEAFQGLSRVRLDTIRVWLEGARFPMNNTVSIRIASSGVYKDRFNGSTYHFAAAPLSRGFQYSLTSGSRADWTFEDGRRVKVDIDGIVADAMRYAYFEPTPFTQWTVTIDTEKSPNLDLSNLKRITMQFKGTAIF